MSTYAVSTDRRNGKLSVLSGVLVTFTGRPSLGMVMFLGILQVISLSRTLASQFTPATVMTMVMQELTKFSFWCWEQRGGGVTSTVSVTESSTSSSTGLGGLSHMQRDFIKARVQTQHVSLGLKRNGLAIRVVGELPVPKSQSRVHVKGKLSFLRLVPGKRWRETLHPGRRGIPHALLKPKRAMSRQLRKNPQNYRCVKYLRSGDATQKHST